MSSVAGLEMAAGLSALSAMDVLARKQAPPLGMDRSERAGRLITVRLGNGGGALVAGTAVSTQKQIEIIFGGAAASCYLRQSMGAEGVVANTSRRPN